MLPIILSIVILLFSDQHGVRGQGKDSIAASGQCVSTSELEGLRYHLYTELAKSKEEIDILRTDLGYWQNETLSILRKYLIEKDVAGETEQSESDFKEICNHTEDIISQVREVMDSYKRAQSNELREIISEMSSGRLPLGTFLNPAPSCKNLPDNSSSGDYWIQHTGTGYASLEYCDMTRRCCNSSGGWMRVAHLDMTDHTHHCPAGFRTVTSPKRTCGRPGSGCVSTTYRTDGILYSQVCGSIQAYQYGSSDGFHPYNADTAVTIDGIYIDGISLTHGHNPRKHIWTFVNAIDETISNEYVCPCTKTDVPYTGVVPPFIGEDYFCDTGSRYRFQYHQLYSEDPLWDGAGCGGTSTCCQFNNPPWFCKQLPQPTTDDIELRLCSDQSHSNEDSPIEKIEIYVQ